MSSLIIIGNGYDRYLGLNSTYKSFFEHHLPDKTKETMSNLKKQYNYRISGEVESKEDFDFLTFPHKQTSKNKFKPAKDSIKISENFTNSLSFWDLIFFFSIEDLPDEWNDIENRIKDFFDSKSDRRLTYKSLFDNEKNYLASEATMVLSLFYGLFPEKRYLEKKNAIDFLKSELELLERTFSDYLNELVKNSKNYHYESRELLLQLLSNEHNDNFSSTTYNHKILSFNYTDPIGDTTVAPNDISYPRQKSQLGESDQKRFWGQVNKTLINVHGSLSNNDIVFGFDSLDQDPLDEFYCFSKTYRQLIGSFSSENHKFCLGSEIMEIKFFGHSLSALDFSYFQAIFDHYHLYDSSIKITFYYATINPTSRQDMVNKVLKLTSAYSESLDNQYHGKNLLHKLLLEKRLFITPLDDELQKL